MAIDPTTPVTPILPSLPAGTPPDSVALLQAMARQALAATTAELGQIVGRPAAPQASMTGTPVEQAGQTSTQDAGHAADALDAKGAPHTPQALATRTPAPETRLARAARVAAAQAVPRQAGLAPLMADVRAVVDRPDAPPEVRAAARALLANTVPAAEIATPQGLRRAVERSGVFLEAKMARAAAPPAVGTPAVPILSNDMKAALLVFRGALSTWLAKAAPPAAEDKATEPEAPGGEAEERAGWTTWPAAPSSQARPLNPSPSSPPDAVVRSSEGRMAEGAPVATAGAAPEAVEPENPSAPPSQSLADPAEDEAIAARFGSFVAAPKSTSSSPAPGRVTMSPLVQLGLLAEEAALEAPAHPQADAKPLVARGYGAPTAEAARPTAPPPPYAGGPMAGQRPTPSSLPADLSPADLVRRLLRGSNGALARQDLMQIASLPEPHHPEAETAEARPEGARLNLDLPFMTPQGVAVAQFEISHDGGGAGGGAVGAGERTYKARFSIDLEPLGPVHALVTLTGARARVSLWAERAETIARLRAGEESLGAALRQAELSPEVAVHSGAPPTPGVSPLGHFVDQAS